MMQESSLPNYRCDGDCINGVCDCGRDEEYARYNAELAQWERERCLDYRARCAVEGAPQCAR